MAPRKITQESSTSYPLQIIRGIPYSRTYILKQKSGPIDLTGKVITFNFKGVFPELTVVSSADSPTALGSEVVITDGPAGEFRFKLTDEETLTAKIASGQKWWLLVDDGEDPLLIWRDCVIVEDI